MYEEDVNSITSSKHTYTYISAHIRVATILKISQVHTLKQTKQKDSANLGSTHMTSGIQQHPVNKTRFAVYFI